jgi:hypothetical protein
MARRGCYVWVNLEMKSGSWSVMNVIGVREALVLRAFSDHDDLRQGVVSDVEDVIA